MMNQLFIQMSEAPGSGKTTLAIAIGRYLNAVVIDHDVLKSALLTAGVPTDLAGRASYQALEAMAQHLLQQGFHVIFDSLCYYQELLDRGQQLAQAAGATFLYIECLVEDLDELDRRPQARSRHHSQVAGVYSSPPGSSGETGPGKEVFQEWIANMKRPKSDYLVLDTTRPFADSLEKAMKYIGR
jgi:predicted kinase